MLHIWNLQTVNTLDMAYIMSSNKLIVVVAVLLTLYIYIILYKAKYVAFLKYLLSWLEDGENIR